MKEIRGWLRANQNERVIEQVLGSAIKLIDAFPETSDLRVQHDFEGACGNRLFQLPLIVLGNAIETRAAIGEPDLGVRCQGNRRLHGTVAAANH